jgi:septal ring factor EnvC (AmiA/AmiB activator)
LERRADRSRARAAELAKRSAELQKDIDAQRDSLTEAAAEVRSGEENLSRIEEQRASLADRKARDTALLEAEHAHLAQLTSGLVRLVRVPPGGLLAWPGAPVDAARGEMLLDAALTSVRTRAEKARLELAELGQLGATLEDKRRETERAAADLQARQVALAALVEKRQLLFQRTERDRLAEEKRAEKAAGAARDLRDLMGRIEAEQETTPKLKAASRLPAPSPKQIEAARRAGLPVVGDVKIRFGQSDGVGAAARGVTLAARPGAAVTAPASGIVRFAGPFRGYREILILEHPGGYHSLIAGMARIDVAVGASLGAGEPVGTMDDRPGAKPELYYELRHNGQPVDPVAAFSAVDVKGTVR